MHRTVSLIVLTGTVIAVPALGVAQAARVGVIPVPGATAAACKVSPPHLLGSGRAPLRPLRLDLTGIGRRPHTVIEVETFETRAKALGGSWHDATEIRKIKGVTKGLGISKGKIRLSSTLTVSFPGTKTVAPAKGGSFTVNGNSDALSGGIMGGSAGNDRFPVEPIGIGATWRVVDCDPIDEAPAKETRTYTLRSFTRDRAVMTYRDVVTMDPTRRDAGSQKVGGQLIKVKLDALHGTATGTVRIPLANGIATFARQVTRARFTFHLVSANLPATPVTTDLVDTRIDTPAG
jgi:hypothetical protein